MTDITETTPQMDSEATEDNVTLDDDSHDAQEPMPDDDPDGPDFDSIPDGLKGYVSKLRRSEADKRTRLKTTADELAYTQERLERLQRREIEGLAASTMAQPSDLWLTTELADLLDDGDVSADKVDQAVADLAQSHPHWMKSRPPYRGPLYSGASGRGEYRPASWASALRQGGE